MGYNRKSLVGDFETYKDSSSRRSSFPAYEGELSSIQVYKENLSSTGLYKEQISSTGLYKEQISSAKLFEGKQNSIDIFENKPSSVSLYKESLTSTGLYKEQISSAKLFDGKLSSVNVFENKPSSINIFEKGEPVSFSILDFKQAGSNVYHDPEKPTIILANNVSYTEMYNTLSKEKSISFGTLNAAESVSSSGDDWSETTAYFGTMLTSVFDFCDYRMAEWSETNNRLENGNMLKSPNTVTYIHSGISGYHIPSLTSLQSGGPIEVSSDGTGGIGDAYDHIANGLILRSNVLLENDSMSQRINVQTRLNDSPMKESTNMIYRTLSFTILTQDRVIADLDYRWGSVCNVYNGDFTDSQTLSLESMLSWKNSTEDMDSDEYFIEEYFNGTPMKKVSGGNLFLTSPQNNELNSSIGNPTVYDMCSTSEDVWKIFGDNDFELWVNEDIVMVKNIGGVGKYVQFIHNSGSTSVENVRRVNLIRKESNYVSWTIEYSSDEAVYVAFRKYKTFDVGFSFCYSNANLWNLFVYDMKYSTLKFPNRITEDNRSDSFDWGASEPVGKLAVKESNKVNYNVFGGTKDVLFKSHEQWKGFANYGGADLIPVLRHSFDKSVVTYNYNGVRLVLPSFVQPLFYPGYVDNFKRKGCTGRKHLPVIGDVDYQPLLLQVNQDEAMWGWDSGDYLYDAQEPLGINDYCNCSSTTLYVNGIVFDSPVVTEIPNTLPPSTKEEFGYDITNNFIQPGTRSYTLGQTKVVPKDGALYQAIPQYPLNPNPNKPIIQDGGEYEIYSNLILSYTDKVTKIYKYTDSEGVVLITTVPGTVISNVFNISGNYYFVVREEDTIAYIYSNQKENFYKAQKVAFAGGTIDQAYIGVIETRPYVIIADTNNLLYVYHIGMGVSRIEYIDHSHTGLNLIKSGNINDYDCYVGLNFNGSGTYKVGGFAEDSEQSYDFIIDNVNLGKLDKQFVLRRIEIESEGDDGTASIFLIDNGSNIATENIELNSPITKAFQGFNVVSSLKLNFINVTKRIKDIKVFGNYLPK